MIVRICECFFYATLNRVLGWVALYWLLSFWPVAKSVQDQVLCRCVKNSECVHSQGLNWEFCKGTIFENQSRSNDGPCHQSIKKKMIVELLMLLAMTRMKMVIKMRSSDQHSRGCQWFPWSLRLLGWLGWPEHHIYVEQIKAWWISSVQTSRSHSLISQLGNSLISTIFCGLMSRWAMFLKMWQVQGLIKICRHIMQR